MSGLMESNKRAQSGVATLLAPQAIQPPPQAQAVSPVADALGASAASNGPRRRGNMAQLLTGLGGTAEALGG